MRKIYEVVTVEGVYSDHYSDSYKVWYCAWAAMMESNLHS